MPRVRPPFPFDARLDVRADARALPVAREPRRRGYSPGRKPGPRFRKNHYPLPAACQRHCRRRRYPADLRRSRYGPRRRGGLDLRAVPYGCGSVAACPPSRSDVLAVRPDQAFRRHAQERVPACHAEAGLSWSPREVDPGDDRARRRAAAAAGGLVGLAAFPRVLLRFRSFGSCRRLRVYV